MKGEPAIDPLIAIVENENEGWSIRGDAIYVLGEIGDPRAVEPLIEALKDKNSNVRETAALALGKIGDPRAVAPLREARTDKDEMVRWSAGYSLEQIGASSTAKTSESEESPLPLLIGAISMIAAALFMRSRRF